MDIVIIKYNAGNIQSVENALHRLGMQATITDDPDRIRSADKVIFPGVGEAETTMNYLKARNLDQLIRSLRQPVLGVCVGLQLMCSHSEEGDVDCIGIFPNRIRKFTPPDNSVKVPHMGWNTIFDLKTSLFSGIAEKSYVYFVHSFASDISEYTIATTDYIIPFSAALQRDNFYAVQFHPEKSADVGSKIIENFLKLC
jgi:glutamine amidotransferase